MNQDNTAFTLTRHEYAEKLGLTVNNLKQRMRRGHHSNDYIRKDNQYFFKPPTALRVIKGGVPSTNVPTKKVNRGNHHKAKYPNRFFKEHNERKMLAKLGETDPDFIKNYQRLKELHKKEKQVELQRKLVEAPRRNYGGQLFNPGFNPKHSTGFKDLYPTPKDEYEVYLEEELGITPGKPKGPTYY